MDTPWPFGLHTYKAGLRDLRLKSRCVEDSRVMGGDD